MHLLVDRDAVRGLLQSSFEPLETERQPGYGLPDLIVKLARDAPLLVLLRLRKAPQEIYPLGFGAFLRVDVGENAVHDHRRLLCPGCATRRSQPVGASVLPDRPKFQIDGSSRLKAFPDGIRQAPSIL